MRSRSPSTDACPRAESRTDTTSYTLKLTDPRWLAPTDEDGWIVEVEIVEDRRIPSSADMLALYEIELDADGELLAYRRTRRYRRGQALDAE
jgi:Gas vesicle synthesis protein GvpO